mmetsp:Transcript_27128/g.49990  ORF Transcript_27128/g.49990 Transcript_27128/m.49990 type:complete len:224 (-) Transcript_27128:797-1468(-)
MSSSSSTVSRVVKLISPSRALSCTLHSSLPSSWMSSLSITRFPKRSPLRSALSSPRTKLPSLPPLLPLPLLLPSSPSVFRMRTASPSARTKCPVVASRLWLPRRPISASPPTLPPPRRCSPLLMRLALIFAFIRLTSIFLTSGMRRLPISSRLLPSSIIFLFLRTANSRILAILSSASMAVVFIRLLIGLTSLMLTLSPALALLMVSRKWVLRRVGVSSFSLR